MSRWGLLLVLPACSTVTVEGRVLDGLTESPVAGPFRILAKATSADAALACQIMDGEVTEGGSFQIAGLCPSTGYRLEPDRADLWFVDLEEVPAGGWGGPKDVTSYRVPTENGVYRVSNGGIELLKTAADVATHTVWKSTQTVRAPSAIPNEVTIIGPGDHLLLVGKGTDELRFQPLVPYTGKRFFGDEGSSYSIDDWAIIGAKSVNDTTVEPMEAKLDPSGVLEKVRGERKARFVSGRALAGGRYALLRDDDRRTYLFDVSQMPAPAPAAEP